MSQRSMMIEDDAAIALALEDLSVPTLMLSLVHMTGDPKWIRGEIKPQGLFLNEVQGFMPEEMKKEPRALALEAIKAYRAGGCIQPPPPSLDLIQEMMNWLVCDVVPEEYLPMMVEEMELDGSDVRAVEWDSGSVAARGDFPVVVIGCGQSGLLAGLRLKEAGIPFTIIEKNPAAGGTWYENTYPGCRVDVGNHFYSYSFEPNDHWSEFFSRQPELKAYFNDVLERHGLGDSVRWEAEVVSADWKEGEGTWTVRTRDKVGREGELVARAVISAVGQLNRAKLPDFPGREDFAGPSFHSECQIRYISGCLKALIEGGRRSMEPRKAVHDEYYERIQKELETLVWSSPHVKHSWYKNAHGKIHILSPWRLVDYWRWTKEPDLADFEFVGEN